jgi:hypothetical protein
VRRGVGDIVLVDERPPLLLTSDKSAECYRNWWLGTGDATSRPHLDDPRSLSDADSRFRRIA